MTIDVLLSLEQRKYLKNKVHSYRNYVDNFRAVCDVYIRTTIEAGFFNRDILILVFLIKYFLIKICPFITSYVSKVSQRSFNGTQMYDSHDGILFCI